tara:strand:- start:23770 stop:24705 length:936 start_codon:yes stop_codon:yes gene_type:complete
MSLFHSLGFAGASYVVLRLVLEQLAEIHRGHLKRIRRGKTGGSNRSRLGIPIVKPGTKICVYGLSANPPTGVGGHCSIVRHLQSQFDEVWILPVYRHVYSTKQNMESYEHRRKMCELAFTHHGEIGSPKKSPKQRKQNNVRVLDVEKKVVLQAQSNAINRDLPLDSVQIGSYDILCEVQSVNNDKTIKFAWCLGGDAYVDLRNGKWRNHEKFQRGCEQVVVPRNGGTEALEEVGLNANTTLLEIEEVSESVSSTVVREMLLERVQWQSVPGNETRQWDGRDYDPEVLTDSLDPVVLRYIEENGLYGIGTGA